MLGIISVELYGCTYERQYFNATEVDDYSAPVVFLKEQKTGKKYFVSLSAPENKYFLDWKEICDFKEKKDFLFTQEKDGIERIYEYNLEQKKYKCLLDEKAIQDYLEATDEGEVKSVYYYPEEGKISFLYGKYLVIYDKWDGFVSNLELQISQTSKVYGWVDSDKFLFTDFKTVYEVNGKSGEKYRINDELGNRITLNYNKTLGTSYGDENYFGVTFSPVMIWSTHDYKVKKYHEGSLSPARAQLSHDAKYIIFGQCLDKNQVLCMNTENEKICVLYETDDFILDILWE